MGILFYLCMYDIVTVFKSPLEIFSLLHILKMRADKGLLNLCDFRLIVGIF